MEAKGLVRKAPHYNSVFNVLDREDVTPILKALVAESAAPCRELEQDFAVDSTGIGTVTYRRWYDEKYGRERSTAKWLKAHAMVGVVTNIITSVEVTAGNVNDNPQLPALVDETARRFALREVSADMGYSSVKTLEHIESKGAKALVPFKSNAKAMSVTHAAKANPSETWSRLYHYFALNRRAFLTAYNKRSNVESTFSAMKRLVGGTVRSKSDRAQMNEALCMCLVYNLTVVVHAIYESGVSVDFWAGSEVAQDVGQK
jgi:transposase